MQSPGFRDWPFGRLLKIDLPLMENVIKSLGKSLFVNSLSANIYFPKNQLTEIVQSGGFRDWLLGKLLRIGLPLMKNVIKPLAKSVLITLGLTAAASAADAGIQNNIFGSGSHNHRAFDLGTTALIIGDKEM